MVAEMIMLFLRSPTRNMNVGRPFRGAMTALREKMRVSALRLAWAVFMNTQPSMMALMIKPRMFWIMRTMIASGHSSVTIRPPKPIVTWYCRNYYRFKNLSPLVLNESTIGFKSILLTCTSMENRKADVKEWMEVTHGTGLGSLGSRSSRSPWANAKSHHTMAKSIQEQRNAEVKMRRECCHFRSTMVVKTSWRKRPWEATESNQ